MREHCEHERAGDHGIQRQHDAKKRMPSVPLHELPIQAKFTSFRRRQLAPEPSLRLPDLIGSGRSQLKHWLKRWPLPPFGGSTIPTLAHTSGKRLSP
jgi:hypothetical protein